MRTLIVYISYHHGNTEKIAKAMGEILEAELRSPESIKPDYIKEFDLIGFASGNYFDKFDKRIVEFVDGLPRYTEKDAFLFSTSGSDSYERAHIELKKHIMEKGLRVVGEWHCKAFDTYGPLKLMGGLNKDRPNDNDVEDAKRFATDLKRNNDVDLH